MFIKHDHFMMLKILSIMSNKSFLIIKQIMCISSMMYTMITYYDKKRAEYFKLYTFTSYKKIINKFYFCHRLTQFYSKFHLYIANDEFEKVKI